MKTFAFLSLILTSLLLLPTSTFGYIDLAEDWKLSPISTSNAGYCAMKRASLLNITGFSVVVVKDGMIAAQSDDQQEAPREKLEVYSTTKSWSSMIIGHMISNNLISLNMTLGEIFDDDALWVDVPQAAEKQQIRLKEVLNYSGGLIDQNQYYIQSTLQDVLAGFRFEANRSGLFSYMAYSHIVSRIIYQVSGLTPREYVTENGIFQAMGITDDDYNWLQFGGIEGSSFGFQTNAQIQAKLGMLYLQNGHASDTTQLIDSDYIQASITNQLPEGTSASVDPNQPQGYGYNWYTDLPVPLPYMDGAYTGLGLLGQQILVVPKLNMVITVVTDSAYDLLRLSAIYLNIDKVDIEEDCGDTVESVDDAPDDAPPDDSTEPTPESSTMSMFPYFVLVITAVVTLGLIAYI